MLKGDDNFCIGLIRVRDGLMAQLRELSKQKPRGQTDENLIGEISRLEAGLTVAKDDLVGFHIPFALPFYFYC
jgi:structural maintenance of chromosome 1